MYKLIILVSIIWLAACHNVSISQGGQLSIETIMQGEDFIGHLPQYHRLLPNDNVLFEWQPKSEKHQETYIYSPDAGLKGGDIIRKLNPKELVELPLNGFEWNEGKTIATYSNNGNLFMWSLNNNDPEVLIKTTDYISNPHFSKDGKSIIYRINNNLFNYKIDDGRIHQLISYSKGEEPVLIKEKKYLERQQKELFQIIRKRDDLNHLKLADKKKRSEFSIPVIYTGNSKVYSNELTPNGLFVVYSTVERASTVATQIHEYVNENGIAKEVKARPKVGRDEDKFSLHYFDFEKSKIVDLQLDKMPELNKQHNYLADYEKSDYKNKGVIFHGPYFNDNGDIAIVEIKSLDNKHRWLGRIDFENGELIPFEHQYDEAWIGGPGISSWNEAPGNVGFLKNSNTCYFQSEETGFSHLYTYDFDKNKKEQLTKGDFEIHDATLSKDGSKFYVIANKKHAGNREFYHFDIKSKKWKDILVTDGKHDVLVSADESQLYYLYSYKNKPTELYHCVNAVKEEGKQITHSTTEEFENYNWREPEVIKFKASDGLEVTARLYQPLAENKNGAAVIFVHGAGYLQNAHNWWSGYYREYMFHNLLVEQGYTVLDIDYRASAGYGRDWRTAIYRDMGGKDLSDQLDGRKYLIEELGINENRVGIYGGSYGGFITIMALLKEPGKFQCGGAIRSVTDWAHYNHEYTSNILNTPAEDSIAFRRSSPIYYAENLEDELLMLHGMMDDNVQFQDVVRLTQRFIELGKDSYEMAIYPIEPHGFKEASSWVDEYKRIYKLFQENLLEK